MTDYRHPGPTISTDEGSSYIEDALSDVIERGEVYAFYREGEDPTNADDDWLKENKGKFPDPAILIPLKNYEELASLRREHALRGRPTTARADQSVAEHTIEIHRARQAIAQTHLLEQEPRIDSIKLAMQAMEQTSNNITKENLIEMAEVIHGFITGTVNEPDAGLFTT